MKKLVSSKTDNFSSKALWLSSHSGTKLPSGSPGGQAFFSSHGGISLFYPGLMKSFFFPSFLVSPSAHRNRHLFSVSCTKSDCWLNKCFQSIFIKNLLFSSPKQPRAPNYPSLSTGLLEQIHRRATHLGHVHMQCARSSCMFQLFLFASFSPQALFIKKTYQQVILPYLWFCSIYCFPAEKKYLHYGRKKW